MNQIELKIEFQEPKRRLSVKATAEILARKQEEMNKSLHISACIVLVLLRDADGMNVTSPVSLYDAAMLDGFYYDCKYKNLPAVLETKTYGRVKFSPAE